MYIDYLCNCPDSINIVSNWIYNEFVHGSRSKLTLENVIEYFSNTNKKDFPITLVSLIDNKCIGTVSIFENDLKTQKDFTPWLASLYVTPDYRGKGVGQKLISKVQGIVRELGFETLYLRTENASNYYKKLGFEFVYSTYDEKGKNTEVFCISIK